MLLRTKLLLLGECNVRMGNEKMGILEKCGNAQVRRGADLASLHFRTFAYSHSHIFILPHYIDDKRCVLALSGIRNILKAGSAPQWTKEGERRVKFS